MFCITHLHRPTRRNNRILSRNPHRGRPLVAKTTRKKNGNDYTSLGGRTGTSAECRLLACLSLCTYCTRVAYEYLYPDHLRGPATARIGPGPRDWPTRVSWDTWNDHDRDRQNVELAPTAAWGIRPKVQHCLLGFLLRPIRKLLYNPSPIDLLPLL